MRYRELPRSSLAISEIGFGSGGNAGLMVRGSVAEQQRVIAHALALGINYFDTAPDYGGGAAEENLGRAFKALGARPIITSKVEIRRENLADIASHVVASCESSLKRLQIERLDCLQIHNGPTFRDPALEGRGYQRLGLQDFLKPRGALEGLHRLGAGGKIDHAGFICRPNDAAAIRELMRTEAFRLINLSYSLVDPGAVLDGILDDSGRNGVGCAVFSPLGGGTLSDDFLDRTALRPLARPHDPSSQKVQRATAIARRLRFLAVENGLTLSQAAYRFVLSHPSVTTVIGGFSSLEQVEEVGKVGFAPFSPADIARVQALWRDAG